MTLHDFPLPPELALEQPPLSDATLAEYLDHGPVEDEAADHPEDYRDDIVRMAVVQRWRVEDDQAAEWALRKLAVANEELARLREQADEWAARIQHWFDQASATHQRTATYMTERLEDYGLRIREAGGPATLTLPSGVVKTSERKPAVEVEDDEAVAALIQRAYSGAESKAWKEALDALDEDVELVKRSAKVYVGPLRKLVRVGEAEDGYDVRVLLRCEHVQEFVVPIIDDLSIPDRGEVIVCRDCPVDSIDGEARVPVELVTMTLRKRLAALGPDGEEVPGVTVKPGGITPKVEAR